MKRILPWPSEHMRKIRNWRSNAGWHHKSGSGTCRGTERRGTGISLMTKGNRYGKDNQRYREPCPMQERVFLLPDFAEYFIRMDTVWHHSNRRIALNSFITSEGLKWAEHRLCRQKAGTEPSVLDELILLKPRQMMLAFVIINGGKFWYHEC